MLPKLRQIDTWRRERKLNFNLEVDGGIDVATATQCRAAGADTFVAGTSFYRVIGESELAVADDDVRRVVLCSGKIYFDLAKARAQNGDDRLALVRIEQLYPFPFDTLAKVLQRYRNAEIVWCQEEQQNMGAWSFVDRRIEEVLARLDIATKRPRFAGRAEAASPATGLFKRHVEEQTHLVRDALAT